MDGIKLPVFLLVLVLGLGVYLYTSTPQPVDRSAAEQSSTADETLMPSSQDPIMLAQKAFSSENYPEVIRSLSSFVNRQDYEIQRMLGYSFAAEKMFDAAIVAFENSLKLRRIPENGYSLAYLYEITGRLNVASLLYQDLLEAQLPPQMNRAVYEGLARTSIFEQDTRRSFRNNSQLIKKYPDSHEGFIALIKIMRNTGQTKGLENLIAAGDRYHSENFEYNFWLGVLLYETGNFDESLTRFYKCIKIDQENSTPYYYSYQILKRQKSISQALEDLEQYHKLNPLLPHIFFEAALDAKGEGRLDLAYKFLRSSLSRDRTLLGRNDRGTLRAIERMIQADASELDKKFFTAFMNYINGDYKIANNQLTHLAPQLKNTHLQTDSERILHECKMLEQQDLRYDRQLREMRHQQELARMASTQSNQPISPGQKDDARSKVRRQAMNNPNDLRLQYSAGLELARMGYPDDAKLFFESALRLNPDILEPHYSLAKLLINQNDILSARTHIDAALRINPNSTQALSVSADLHLKNRDFSRAKSDAEASIRANPNNGEARIVLAEVYARNNDLRQAITQIDMGLEVERDPQRREKLLRLRESLRN